jgi:hypothetical protein
VAFISLEPPQRTAWGKGEALRSGTGSEEAGFVFCPVTIDAFSNGAVLQTVQPRAAAALAKLPVETNLHEGGDASRVFHNILNQSITVINRLASAIFRASLCSPFSISVSLRQRLGSKSR